jgi:hypothetical protein
MLKNFTLIALSCFVISFISSCTKDSADSANPGGTSFYSFDGAPGTCATPAIAGIYAVGRPLNLSNTLTFTVNVTVIGTYSITTTPGNGVFFAGSGTFTTTGPQSIVLTGQGTPAAAGNFPYVPVTSNTCNFTVSFLSGAPAAVFTYAGAPAACTAPVISGTYAATAPMGSGNYVDMAVNVTTPGAYTVSTNSNNGMSFSGSGAFSTTGAQVIRLIGNGTPSSTGTFDYTPTNNGCKFSVTVVPPPPPAVFTYTNCGSVVPQGTYTAGTALNSSNTIVLTVNVTSAGAYSVSTNLQNGVTFRSSGSFSATGPNSITLTSTDTPLSGATFPYIIAGGCSFNITYTGGLPPATFTYNGAPGNCTAPVINGTFAAGTALTSSSTITLGVNVTVAGSYSISTNGSNGVTFSASGVFLTTGAQTITLTSTNTPTSAGLFTYTPSGGCSFSITYTGGGGGGGDFLRCTIDGTPMDFSSGLSGLLFGGGTGSFTARGYLGNARFDLELNDNNADIAVGTYDKYTLANPDKYCDVTYWPNFVTGPGNFWSPWATNANTFTVTVQTLNTTTRKITGIFFGDVFDFLGANQRVITAGTFSITY